MSIQISSSAVTISNETVSFEDIYDYAVSKNKTSYVKQLGDSYLITTDVRLTNNAIIRDTNKFITVEGDLFQIEKGSKLHLGTKRSDGSVIDGCTLNIPNVKLAYGFGSTTISNSGDLLLYGSTINAFGFWGFFEGNNHVEIIDCFIDGFGRVSGADSIIKNIKFKKSHGRYGSFSALGAIQEMSNNSVYDVDPYQTNIKCSIYHNPELAGDLTLYYGEYSGYDDLVYMESYNGVNTCELRGSTVKDGYNLYREANNIDFYHSFRYKGKTLSLDGDALSNVNIKVRDRNGDLVHDTYTDENGDVDIWIKYYQSLRNDNSGEILTPHTFEFTKGEISYTSTLYVDENFENIPIYLFSGGSGSGGGSCNFNLEQIQQMIDSAKTEITDKVIAENNRVENKVGQVMIALSEDIEETTQLIESHSDISVIA